MQRPIYIIGTGAIGMTLAVFLQQAGKDVYLLRGRPDKVPDGNILITVECSDGSVISERVRTGMLVHQYPLNGLIVLTTKAFGNSELANRLRANTGQSPVILLQNGLGIEQSFLDAGFPNLYRCVLLATSQIQVPQTVSYKAVAPSPVGIVRGQEDELNTLIEHLSTPRFAFRPDLLIEQTVWEKVITNCVFNSICPLLEVDNGIFYRDKSALSVAREVIAECVTIAGLAGIQLTKETVEHRLLQISQRSDGQLISTLVDIHLGRETEIDSLNLAVAQLAEQLGKPELAIRTRLLGDLLKRKGAIHQTYATD